MKQHLLLPALCALPLFGAAQLDENFDNAYTLEDNGWTITNQSNPLGISSWFPGLPNSITAYNGADTSFIAANFNSTAGTGDISTWLITPSVNVQDGDVISFWTSTATGSIWNDRLEVRASTGAMTLPSGSTDVGSFTTLLLIINDGYNLSYPESWTMYEATVNGVGSTPVAVNYAFRYNVANGGPTGSNSNFIGIDALHIGAPVGVEENASASLAYFPNPMDKELHIRARKPIKSYCVFSAVGQQVLAGTGSGLKDGRIDVAGLPAGIYLFQVNLANGHVESFRVTKG